MEHRPAPGPADRADGADRPDDPAVEPAIEPPAPPRQRWRLILARGADAPALAGRELTEVWEGAVEASGLPLFRPTGRTRARVAFGAPIPAALVAEGELADIVLTEFLPAWLVRERITEHLPAGWTMLDIHDVWLGGPALAGQVTAADYRIDIGEADVAAIAEAASTLLASERLSRERPKGNSLVRYDLRPLLVDVGVASAGPPVIVRARTRFDPVLGTGRPEEVMAALSEASGVPLTVGSIVRERLVLAEDLDRSGAHDLAD